MASLLAKQNPNSSDVFSLSNKLCMCPEPVFCLEEMIDIIADVNTLKKISRSYEIDLFESKTSKKLRVYYSCLPGTR
ncbi:hypothetical protein AYI68_g8177 [Smittium mucronatum]|uniref:Uncharacterized protein n=1 Tax=Smittium mucronatum TaxID=133383 RepID=A0A1R0GLN3_9FUNG|nr:hypothetical protein AYI68_g8177 [Smittium mucronatum]